MRFLVLKNHPLNLQPWFLTVLAAYAVLELSFNHRLLELAGDIQLRTTAAQLNDLEIWGRVVSGLGLALLLMRWLERFLRSIILLLFISCTLGLSSMWYAQRALVDAIVMQADAHDLMMSWRAQLTTQDELNGRVLLRGEILLSNPAPDEIQPVMRALWASSVVALSPDDLDLNAGAAQLMSSFFEPQITQQQLTDVYRKTVMTPVVLGASLLFGLLNLCQFFSGVSALMLITTRQDRLLQRCNFWLLPSLIAVCIGLSWWPGNTWTRSPGYSLVARPALWTEKPLLAPFVEWSARAEPAWTHQVAWVHRALLQDFAFTVPFRHLMPFDPKYLPEGLPTK